MNEKKIYEQFASIDTKSIRAVANSLRQKNERIQACLLEKIAEEIEKEVKELINPQGVILEKEINPELQKPKLVCPKCKGNAHTEDGKCLKCDTVMERKAVMNTKEVLLSAKTKEELDKQIAQLNKRAEDPNDELFGYTLQGAVGEKGPAFSLTRGNFEIKVLLKKEI